MKLNLLPKQLLFLKLYILDKNNQEIKQFLNLTSNELSNIKRQLVVKFGTNCFISILFICLENNYLNNKDFINESLKKNCLNYLIQYPPKNHDNFIKYLSDFYKNVVYSSVQLYSTRIDEEKLSLEEVTFLNLYFKKQKNIISKSSSNLNHNMKFSSLRKNILKKLEVSNWYNAIKKAYLYGLINRNIENELDLVHIICNKNSKLKNLNKLNNKFVHALLYEEMLNIIWQIQYVTLWRSFRENSFNKYIGKKNIKSIIDI